MFTSKKEQLTTSPIELSIDETIDKLSYIFTEHCFNKERCTTKLKNTTKVVYYFVKEFLMYN
jgi:hypothetical protein